MKEIYNSQHIYTLIEKSFCPDIEKVREKQSDIDRSNKRQGTK
jgi:hypothetical protein